MKTPWSERTRDCVTSARFFLYALLLLSVFVQTRQQQRETKPKWDNRLLPTNSVYEQPDSIPPAENVPSMSSKNDESVEESKNDRSSSVENDEEIFYDDDYVEEGEQEEAEEEGKEEAKPVSSLETSSRENRANHEKLNQQPNESTANAAYYYYYDDDNATSTENKQEEADYFDASEEIVSSSGAPPSTSSPSPPSSTSPNPSSALPPIDDSSSHQSNPLNAQSSTEEKISEAEILIGEAVVSVVTTKSVVNGTISVPVSPQPMTTEQMSPPTLPTSTANPGIDSSSDILDPMDQSETTEDSRIVASVQTSRSISGARFLPFLVVEGVEKNPQEVDSTESLMEKSGNSTKKSSQSPESTESIIDKLDRVQSELSGGFLAGGFRNSGNSLQLDLLSEQRPQQTRKIHTTTSRTPIISKFTPKRLNQERKISVTTTASPAKKNETSQEDSTEKSKFRWPSSSRNSRPISSTTENSKNHFGKIKKPDNISPAKGPDLSAFLPPGFKIQEEEVTEKSLLTEILEKSKFDISALLPKNFRPEIVEEKIEEKAPLIPKEIIESDKISSTTQKSTKERFATTIVDVSAFLPPGYNRFKKVETVGHDKPSQISTESPVIASTTPRNPGAIKLVFPSRPGGRKAANKATTTTQSSKNEAASGGAVSPKIQKGWPVRATTEFTGWPTPSTTPISIEKLLEAARTATISSTNISVVPITSTSSTTSTSTTTTTTPRPTTPGICEEECEVAGTIRIVGNATWVPELLDRNTQEWQLLAEEIEKEMNLVFVKSSVLRKWYKRVRIDAFSPGSILVDYFIELTDLNVRVNTQELKVIFHDSLRTYNTDKWNETRATGPIRLGAFALDPKFTDFVVIPKMDLPLYVEADDRLIPQWAIAVIVIGVGGLLFIIVFGVSVLVNRQNAAKMKPSQAVYTEEVAKNMIQASHGAPSHRSSQDYPKSEISTIWNDTTVWRDKSFESNSNEVLMDGTLGRERNHQMERSHHRGDEDRKYNMYDSWRSEWNGYYYNPSHGSSKFAGYESTTNLSRHPPDYDTNF